jgi:signal transduction histidine kinase/CheY-like chemotaxis protein
MKRAFIAKLFERIVPASIGQMLLLSILAYGTYDTVQIIPAYKFLIYSGLFLNFIRLLYAIRMRLDKTWNPDSYLAELFLIVTLFTSLIWGLSSLLLLRVTGLSTQTWMAFMLLSGVGSSAALSLAPFPRLAQTFICLLLGPDFIKLLLSSDPYQWSVAGIFALYFIFLQSHILYQEDLERAVYEKEAQLRSVMDTAFSSIPGIVWTVMPDGTPDFFNKKWLDYTGIPPRGDLSCWAEAVHPDDFEKFQASWIHASKTGISYEGEFRIKRATDQAFRLHIARMSPARDGEGNILKWFGTCLDVEDRKTAEEEKSQAIVREKAAVESARLKSEFLANMSHEVRTPLNGILGMTELILDSSLNEQQISYLQLIRGSGESLLAIINDILDFSKIEAGKLELEQTNFDLANLVSDQADLLVSRAEAKGLVVNVEVDPKIPSSLEGDPVRVGQILLNLIGNAIKFTQQGRIEIKATFDGKENGWNKITFSVRDEGVGIHPDTQRLLFQPFTQADNSTARNYGGTGLGLSICKKLVQLMSGQIGVESELGKGAKFWFTLSFLQPFQPVVAVIDPDLSPDGKIESCPMRTQKILVAEDNSMNQVMILATLKKLGFNAKIACNGKEALAALAQIDYDLVLMDCQMPEMDGFTATQNIREIEKKTGKHIPILALTANAMIQDQERCLQSGMDDYITKPVKRKTLEIALNKWLGL